MELGPSNFCGENSGLWAGGRPGTTLLGTLFPREGRVLPPIICLGVPRKSRGVFEAPTFTGGRAREPLIILGGALEDPLNFSPF